MVHSEPVTGVPLDEAALDLEELARACAVEPGWVLRHVRTGLLLVDDAAAADGAAAQAWRFRSAELDRARRLLALERDFDANDELAALVVDLVDELRRLRTRLHSLGIR